MYPLQVSLEKHDKADIELSLLRSQLQLVLIIGKF